MSPSVPDASGDRAEFPARYAMLPATAAFARGFCDRHGIGHDDAMRLTLVIEELFSNTVRHGYGDECGEPIGIALAIDDGCVKLTYEDRAPPFDPLQQMSAPPADLAAPVEARPVGGLGVHLIGELICDARYAYEHGFNRLWLTLARQS